MSASQLTAVIYLRVSTKDQAERGGGEGFSIPAQRQSCLKKAESLGAVVVDEFTDRGESAKSADRPALQAMLKHLAQHPTSFVIVHKVDRLARNRADDVEINLAIQAAGATLVSCSESIDETPSGMLLHGIMSSIAEFYSRNLATEVKKGSLQKAEQGGTVGKAPTGYLNVRKMDNGREVRTVDVDPVRGPLMQWAFERYAEGDISTRDLLAELTDKGLDTTPGPNSPSKPLRISHLHRLLRHPYYKGLVLYKGVTYPGNHPALVSGETWEQVQVMLESRGRTGEKQRKHRHYLKGTVFCGSCSSRLIVSNAKSKTGKIYPYFVCLGRQEKRTECHQSAVLIKTVESLVEHLYGSVQPSLQLLDLLSNVILDEIQERRADAEQERTTQERRRQQLLDKQAKLLQAHYADALPLELLKSEQVRISQELQTAETRLTAVATRFAEAEANLAHALRYAQNLQRAYLASSPDTRRLMNQAIFKKIYVDDHGTVTSEFTDFFALLLAPELTASAKEQPTKANDVAMSTAEMTDRSRTASGSTNQKPPHRGGGLSETILVGAEGLEPPTPSL